MKDLILIILALGVIVLAIMLDMKGVNVDTIEGNSGTNQVLRSDEYINRAVILLGCPGGMAATITDSIRIAESRTGIDGVFIASLLFTESTFNVSAVSRKGYRGLMQTPTASGYIEVDVLHGALILKDKLRLAKGDYFEAVALYKGGRNPEARKQARKVLVLYKQVLKEIG